MNIPKKDVKLHVELYLDDQPLLAKEFMFDLEKNDLIFKSDKKQKMEGGFIGPLLTSLLPMGIELFSNLLTRGNGIYGAGFLEGNGVNQKDLKKKVHEVKVFDKKSKNLLKKFKTTPLGGALLHDPKFFKQLIFMKDHIGGRGLYAAGVYGGQIGSNQYINS
jgi:hypothetical protein